MPAKIRDLRPSYCDDAMSVPHYWRLASPSGMPTTAGTCQRCGEMREFQSALNYLPWSIEKHDSHGMD